MMPADCRLGVGVEIQTPLQRIDMKTHTHTQIMKLLFPPVPGTFHSDSPCGQHPFLAASSPRNHCKKSQFAGTSATATSSPGLLSVQAQLRGPLRSASAPSQARPWHRNSSPSSLSVFKTCICNLFLWDFLSHRGSTFSSTENKTTFLNQEIYNLALLQ